MKSVDVELLIDISEDDDLSSFEDIRGHTVVGIQMPADWDAADITFAAAVESDGTFGPVKDADGEVSFTVDADDYVVVDYNLFRGINFLKIRSGTEAVPVAQAADRSIKLILMPDF